MHYDFDKPVERRGSGAVKFDALGPHYGREDLLPMWVADMDFETPDFVVEDIQRIGDDIILIDKPFQRRDPALERKRRR